MHILRHVADPLVPVVSLVPDSLPWIDLAGKSEYSAWERARFIQNRLRNLPESIRHSAKPDDILLARMYSRDHHLEAVYDSTSRDLVRYPIAGSLHDVSEIAARLFNQGFLTRTFFDRLHCCPDCRSAHLIVREECHHCQSTNIVEQTTIHHFRCGHMAPESSFRTGSAYECPKCGRILRHIGLDYDKPGSVTLCEECGRGTDKPAVGFKCADCGAHHRPEAVPVKTWYSYALTATGVQRVLSGRSSDTHAPQGGPDAFELLLGHAQREQREFKAPYQVAVIRFANRDEVIRENPRLWTESMKLMVDVLHSALREVDVFREEPEGFLVLMPRTDKRGAHKAMTLVRKRMAEVLQAELVLEYRLLEDGDLRHVSDRAA